MTRHSNSNRTHKRGKSLEETQVEDTVFISFLLALIPFLAFSVVLPPFKAGYGFLSSMSVLFSYLFGSHAIVSVLIGIRFRFSAQQFGLLAKYILALDIATPIAMIAYGYPLFTIFPNIVPSDFAVLGGRIIGLAVVLLLFLTLFIGKKAFGRQFSDWFRIRRSTKSSVDDATKLFLKGQRELTRRNYEGAGESFSFAAWTYADQQKWSDAGESFQRAAEAYSNDKNLQFGSACEYCFAAACFIINEDSERANNTIQTVKQAISDKNLDSKGRETVSKLLTFLELAQDGETEKAQNAWKTLKKKIPEWMWAFPDQALNLFEKCLEQTQKQP